MKANAQIRGFTLLEVLLATLLSATLLAITWGLMGIYLELFEKGSGQVEQSRLARAVLQQFSDDLLSAIEDSPGTVEAADLFETGNGGSPDRGGPVRGGPVRRFGLMGTSQTLQIDVLQGIALEESPMLSADVTGAPGDPSALQVPELRTIYYDFAPPEADAVGDLIAGSETLNADLPAMPGLTRRELDFETPYGSAGEAGFGQATAAVATTSAITAADLLDSSPALDASSSATASPNVLDSHGRTHLAEVVGLALRYFDGSRWSNEWDSLRRKSLPVAVEVSIQVRPPGEPQPLPLLDTNSSGVETVNEDDWGELESEIVAVEPQPLPPTTYRLVIDLPSARQHRTVRSPSPSVRSRRSGRPTPLVVPSMAIPGMRAPGTSRATPAATASRADEWIRKQP